MNSAYMLPRLGEYLSKNCVLWRGYERVWRLGWFSKGVLDRETLRCAQSDMSWVGLGSPVEGVRWEGELGRLLG